MRITNDIRTWPAFERLVAALQRRLDPAANVTWNERIFGRSGTSRQLDVVVRGRVGSAAVMVVVECKEYASKVGIELVEAFLAKLTDVGAQQGIMVAKTGFTEPALARAAVDGLITSVLRPARDEDWEGYLRSLDLKVVSRVIVHQDLEIELVDGRRLRVSAMEQVADTQGHRTFLDQLIDGWLHTNTWKDDVPLMLSLAPPPRLLRDDEEPGVAFIRCRPKGVDGFEVESLVVSPEDWVLYRELPGGRIDEKKFVEFAELDRLAKTDGGEAT